MRPVRKSVGRGRRIARRGRRWWRNRSKLVWWLANTSNSEAVTWKSMIILPLKLWWTWFSRNSYTLGQVQESVVSLIVLDGQIKKNMPIYFTNVPLPSCAVNLSFPLSTSAHPVVPVHALAEGVVLVLRVEVINQIIFRWYQKSRSFYLFINTYSHL